ncbi:hypothetical protein BHY05_000584 [Salmonella enterica subsp. enterica serovar Ruiru]|nr:hypothetical protein [Salmonella enterica subsp. enterica serovar Ruiru]
MKSNSSALPFLARLATERTEGENIPGWYSYEQDLLGHYRPVVKKSPVDRFTI